MTLCWTARCTASAAWGARTPGFPAHPGVEAPPSAVFPGPWRGSGAALLPRMNLHLQTGAATHVGRRKNNEDHFTLEPELGLYVVADGMGGYEGGEVASHLAVDSLRAFFRRHRRDPLGTWPCGEDRRRRFEENLLAAACERAHLDVLARRTGSLAEMGSTVVAALAHGELLTLAHVGDSRAYRLRHGALERLTRDHSVQAELEAEGLSFPHRNFITRALGVAQHAADVSTFAPQPGDVVLLCSDGLYEALEAEALRAALSSLPPSEAAASLVAQAVEAGASDNVTVVVLRWSA